MHIVTILKAARLRLDVGVFSPTMCMCSRGKGLKGPHSPDEVWCPLCAVEASQISGKFSPDCYGLAIIELTTDATGKTYPLTEWIERDVAFMAWFEKTPKGDVLSLFDRTVSRLERQDRT